jgi:hypothetical protein
MARRLTRSEGGRSVTGWGALGWYPEGSTLNCSGSVTRPGCQVSASAADPAWERIPRQTGLSAVEPDQLGDGDHSVFVSGDDAAAEATVTELLRSFGWRDVIDLGDLSTARGAEMYLVLWVRLMPALGGTSQSTITVVR